MMRALQTRCRCGNRVGMKDLVEKVDFPIPPDTGLTRARGVDPDSQQESGCRWKGGNRTKVGSWVPSFDEASETGEWGDLGVKEDRSCGKSKDGQRPCQ